MFRDLCPDDKEKVRKLTEIRKLNNEIAWMLCDYLNHNPCFITKELMDSANIGGSFSEETVYIALLTAKCGLDPENNECDKHLVNDYLRQSVKMLDAKKYMENPFYRKIRIPKVKYKNWKFMYESYRPYEAFIYNDIIVNKNFKEIPQIGFFNEEFKFPAVMENDREWMSIKPNEIETMQPVIDIAEGNVVTFGLGIGYFTYMVSQKDSVTSITVVEKDKEVVKLFEYYILPQFQHKEKVTIISADAFEFSREMMSGKDSDYVFVDLWHDVSDGLDMYIKMKKMERLNNKAKFFYWIEDSLLSGLRWHVFDRIIENSRSYKEIVRCLSNEFLENLAVNTSRSTIFR